jgi:hypothetical protein
MEPASNHPPEGETDPEPAGLTPTDTRYWGAKSTETAAWEGTATLPEATAASYLTPGTLPGTTGTLQPPVPEGTPENDIDDDVDVRVTPSKVACHAVPAGRPVSVTATL